MGTDRIRCNEAGVQGPVSATDQRQYSAGASRTCRVGAVRRFARDPVHLVAVGLFMAIPRVPRPTFSTTIKVMAPGLVGAKLTSRAIQWALDLLRHDDTTVSAIVRRLGVDWRTCWSAVKQGPRREADQDR